MMRPISGRFRAASMKRCVCAARYSGEPPLRSCSCIVKPAPVPRPGNRRRAERDDRPFADLLRERPVERGDDAVGVLLRGDPVAPTA